MDSCNRFRIAVDVGSLVVAGGDGLEVARARPSVPRVEGVLIVDAGCGAGVGAGAGEGAGVGVGAGAGGGAGVGGGAGAGAGAGGGADTFSDCDGG